jgi:hypothetical protein
VRPYNSAIHGLGLVAKEHIDKGEIIFIYGGVIVPKTEIKDYWKELGHIGLQIGDDFWICPTSRKEIEDQGVVNHSCEPNAGFQNQITLIAMSEIILGEEITFDYAFSESFMEGFECKCGRSNCRKKITEDDWKIKSIREKYEEYYSPYLKKK